MSASRSAEQADASHNSAARDGDLLEVITHRYAQPLALYARASAVARIDDADAMVQRFCAQLRARTFVLNNWRTSGLPLRRWLLHEFLMFARARLCELNSSTSAQESCNECGGCACASAATTPSNGETTCTTSNTALPLEPHAFEHFERAWSHAMMEAACSTTQRALEAGGEAVAWSAFRLHFLEKMEYSALAQQVGITAASARSIARRAHECVEVALRQLLRDEGVVDEDIDDELAWMIEVFTR